MTLCCHATLTSLSFSSLAFSEPISETDTRVIVFGPQSPARLPENWVHGGKGRMSGDALSQHIPDLRDRRVYLSGPPALVNDLKSALRTNGAKRIHTDYFSGY